MKLLAELRRRNVIRMAGLYLVGAWLVVQVAQTVLPAFDVPSFVLRALITLLAVGFLPALVFSWIFELTPEGLKRESEITPTESMTPQTAQRMDRVIIVVLLVALAYFAVDKFVLAPNQAQAGADAKEGSVAASKAGDLKSIAVLAFANMSADKANEYFSDGVAEEILNALAQVPGLRVAGRTSAFHFKGRNEDLREIGRALNVAYILEGSVRMQEQKVRITAQLIRGADGFHLWSETYDGDLSDVFALQERIARAITGQLEVVLSGRQTQQLVDVGTTNTEAYALYLQASAIFNRRDSRRFLSGIERLKKAVAIDPTFARAHARLASMYAIASEYTPIDLDEALRGAREHAEIAIALNPLLAEPHAAMARVHGAQGRYVDEQDEFEQALALDPNDVTANFWFGSTQFTTGYIARGNASMDKALARDPMLPMALLWRGMSYSEAGDQESASRLLQRAEDIGLALVGTGWSEVAEARADIPDATRQLAAGTEVLFSAFEPGTAADFALACYGDSAARERVMAQVNSYLAGEPAFIDGIVPYVLARLNEPLRAMKLAETKRLSHPMYLALLWGPYGKTTRQLPEFAAFARQVGFAELWDLRGPPDLCRRVGPMDYRCE